MEAFASNKAIIKSGNLVLVRNADNEKWMSATFSHYDKNNVNPYYTTYNYSFKYCIPFNTFTEHLVNTNAQFDPNYTFKFKFGDKVYFMYMGTYYTGVYINESIVNGYKCYTVIRENKNVPNDVIVHCNVTDIRPINE